MSMPSSSAARQDVGEVLLQKRAALVRDVEVHAVEAVLFHLEVDGAGHDVARGQFGAFVVLRHEARATGRWRQLELAAFAAHRFADEKDFSCGWYRQVGWNWMNSMFATRQPARQAAAMPSPVAVSGLVVYRYTLPAPPVARMVCGARKVTTSSVSLVQRVQAQAAVGRASPACAW
jgi:hypothetical protein